MSKQKYYVVWKGHVPGVYGSWADCERQIKGFPQAQYKSFKSRAEAAGAFEDGLEAHHRALGELHPDLAFRLARFKQEIDLNSISVDAACSGNPGIMEYRGVETATGKELFRMGPFPQSTNNIGEFLALVHGLALLKKDKSPLAVYTDSVTALSWIRHKTVRTKLPRTPRNGQSFHLIDRAIRWLNINQYHTKILKWNTERWGEIPADFGRK